MLGCVAVAGLVALLFLRSRMEPEIDGHSISEHLANLARSPGTAGFTNSAAAILSAGDRAFPVILDNLREPTPVHVRWYLRWRTNLPPAVSKKLFEWLDPYHFDNRRIGAVRFLNVLGTNGAAMAPDLVQLVAESDPAKMGQLVGELHYLGPAVVNPIRPLLTNETMRTRSLAASVIYQLGRNATNALPELIAGLNGADRNHQRLVAQTLSRMGSVVAPQIVELLERTNAVDLIVGLEAISGVMPMQRNVTDRLVKLLNHPSLDVRFEAAMALSILWPRVTPEFAANLESHADKSPAFVEYLAAFKLYQANAALVTERLREGLTHPDPRRRFEIVDQLFQKNLLRDELAKTLDELAVYFASDPSIQMQIRRMRQHVSLPGPEFNAVPTSQSPPSTGRTPPDKSP